MPRQVNKDQRKAAIVDATWQLIKEGGFSNVTMRHVAEETGLTNGALKPYFSSSSDLMRAAYETAFQKTIQIQNEATAGKRGLEALQAFCEAAMPTNNQMLRICRVTTAFWEKAICESELGAIYDANMFIWDAFIKRFLSEGIDDGDIRHDIPMQPVTDQIIWFLNSVQLMCHICNDITADRQMDVLALIIKPITVKKESVIQPIAIEANSSNVAGQAKADLR